MNNKFILTAVFSLITSMYCEAMYLRTPSPAVGSAFIPTGMLHFLLGYKKTGKTKQLISLWKQISVAESPDKLDSSKPVSLDVSRPSIFACDCVNGNAGAKKGQQLARFDTDTIIERIKSLSQLSPLWYVLIDNVQRANKKLIPVVQDLLKRGVQIAVTGRIPKGKNYVNNQEDCMPEILAISDKITPIEGLYKLANMPIEREYPGDLTLHTGPMACRKTEQMMIEIMQLHARGHSVYVCTSSLDTRAKEFLHSRAFPDIQIPVTHIENTEQIKQYFIQNPFVHLYYDEIEFADPTIIPVFKWLMERGIHIHAFGLNMDFKLDPFGTMPSNLVYMPDMFMLANYLVKLTAICAVCRKEATATQRLKDGKPVASNDPVVSPEGSKANETYQPRCRACHEVLPATNMEMTCLLPTHVQDVESGDGDNFIGPDGQS